MLAQSAGAGGCVRDVDQSRPRAHREGEAAAARSSVPFPFGMALGRPNDPGLQHRVLRAALELLASPSGRCSATSRRTASRATSRRAPQASGITPAERVLDDVATETTQMRRYRERWLETNGGRTHFGLTGIPATRFRGVVRFLEEFADGRDADMAERSPEVPLPNFIRYCADDLKSLLYFEGHRR